MTTTNSGLSEKTIVIFSNEKVMKTTKRKTRSDKFPLTRHPTGQYCKKIRGRMYYFGSDKKQALVRYLDQATYIHGGRNLIRKTSIDSQSIGQPHLHH